MPDEDPDNCRASFEEIKDYVEGDPQWIPSFIDEISEAIDAAESCEDDLILLFDVLARLHGRNIVPHIGKIMSAILKTLSFGVESFESCSKVVSAIGLYGIDPLAPDRDNMKILQSLSKPLSDTLMCYEGNTSSGAALCLKGLVNLDVWRFASDEIVNEICLKVAGALGEAPTQTNSHIALVMALAEHNTWVLEAYVRSIVRSGLKILSNCSEDNTSQKCFLVIQMINFLMRRVDARSFFSEIESIIEFMEKWQCYPFLHIQDAAFEAIKTAKIIAASGGQINEESEACRTSTQSPNFNSANLLAESAWTNSKRPFSIGDVRMTSTSRTFIPSRSYSNSTVRNPDKLDFYQRLCETHMLPNETDYHNVLCQRIISDNHNMRKEQKIQDELLRGEGIASFDSRKTLNLRKFNVRKALFAQICGISMIFLVIILMFRLLTNDQVLFDVFPT